MLYEREVERQKQQQQQSLGNVSDIMRYNETRRVETQQKKKKMKRRPPRFIALHCIAVSGDELVTLEINWIACWLAGWLVQGGGNLI